MDTTGTLQLRTESDGCAKLDERWLVLDSLTFLESRLNAFQIMITICNNLGVPAVGFKTLDNILSKGTISIAINRDVIVVIDCD